jgi:hypothetical protein
MPVELAMPKEGTKQIVYLSEWVKLKLYDPLGGWKSKTVCAMIAPSLCVPVILGGPFLAHNNIVVDHAACTTTARLKSNTFCCNAYKGEVYFQQQNIT